MYVHEVRIYNMHLPYIRRGCAPDHGDRYFGQCPPASNRKNFLFRKPDRRLDSRVVVLRTSQARI